MIDPPIPYIDTNLEDLAFFEPRIPHEVRVFDLIGMKEVAYFDLRKRLDRILHAVDCVTTADAAILGVARFYDGQIDPFEVMGLHLIDDAGVPGWWLRDKRYRLVVFVVMWS